MLEVLRLYPPVTLSHARVALEDVMLSNGLSIEEGTIVMTSPWHIHRSPEYWTDPERFDPERFDDDNR